VIRTALAALYCFIIMAGFIVFGAILYLLTLTPLKKFGVLCLRIIIIIWTRGMIFLLGMKVTVKGRENLKGDAGVCLVSNHCSILDIIVLMAVSTRIVSFIARKELALIPFLNLWILILGGVFIDRDSPRKALKTIKTAVKHIQNGGTMLIFPEGTRSRGRGLLPFKEGAFSLALKSGARLVPVALTGTYEAFEKNMRVEKSAVSVVFGEGIEIKALEKPRETLPPKVHAVIEGLLGACDLLNAG